MIPTITPREAHRLVTLMNSPEPVDFTTKILSALDRQPQCTECGENLEPSVSLEKPAPFLCHWCEGATR